MQIPPETETRPRDEPDGLGRKRKTRSRGKEFRLPRRFENATAGSAPGLDSHELSALPSTAGSARVTCIDYSPTDVRVEEVQNLSEFMDRHRPDWSVVRWINVDGLSDLAVIRAFAEKYHLHPLTIEDVLNVPQ